MTNDHPSPKRPLRASRWSAPPASPGTFNRSLFRLIGIPALAVAGVLIYRGMHDRFVLPECDSSRAKTTLGDVLKQLKIEPLQNQRIKTISSGKDRVECNVVLPLADGGDLNVDYSFFWQGSTVQMKYSISHRPAESTGTAPPAPPRSE